MTLPEEELRLQRSCPLCEATWGQLLCALRFALFEACPLAAEMKLVSCKRCGFVFYDTPSSQEEFHAYYAWNTYYCTSRTPGSGRENANDARVEQQLARVQAHLSQRDGLVVDVGCGQGGLALRLRRAGFAQVLGVDPLPANVDHLNGNPGVDARVGSASQLPIAGQKVSTLIYSHVLEHVIDLRKVVYEARRVLLDDGLVYAEVPDARQYAAGPELPYRELYLEHVNHFGLDELVGLFANRGFRCVERGSCSMPSGEPESLPCLFGVFRRDEGSPGSAGEGPWSRTTGQAVRDYVARCRQHRLIQDLACLAQSQTPVSVWGISQHAMLLLGQTSLGACQLRSFVDVDSHKQQQRLMGRDIQAPEVLRGAGADELVLVTADRYRDEIVACLRAMHFRGRIMTLRDLSLAQDALRE